MSRRTQAARTQAVDGRTAAEGGHEGRRTWGIAAAAAAILLGGGWYLLQPSRATRIAARTIAMQQELLAKAADPAPKRKVIEEITRNVDALPPDEIKRVRDALFRQLKSMREESLERFSGASPDERVVLLDDDLERIRLARRLIDATDQGGMRPITEAEMLEREERRRQRENQPKQAAATPKPAAAKPATPRPQTEEQKQFAEYFEALSKRAKEKKVDLGRMFGRPPGRG